MELFAQFVCHSAEETQCLGSSLTVAVSPGDIFLLSGPLGSGKTTFVRGFLQALGHKGHVRSPTFNLIQTFETSPPVMHADLYRVSGIEGLGLEDYLDSHVCIIEWPDRAPGFLDPALTWRISFELQGETVRRISVQAPEDD